jgi:hypothetical protein
VRWVDTDKAVGVATNAVAWEMYSSDGRTITTDYINAEGVETEMVDCSDQERERAGRVARRVLWALGLIGEDEIR